MEVLRELIEEEEKEHELSQDAMHGKQDAIQKLTDGFVKRVDEAVAGKEREVLEM
jgi:ribosome recycling factor